MGQAIEGDSWWRAFDLRMLLIVAFALQVYAWMMLEGYRIADSVEYMDRAYNFALGQDLASESVVRSFAFSSIFLPVFKLADWLGLEDYRPLVWIGRVLQMALSLYLIVATTRLASLFVDRGLAWVAGAGVAFSPVFLSYSVEPVAGIASALCIVLGLQRLLWPASARQALFGGLWFGAAILCSYKSLLVVLIVLLYLVARDRKAARHSWVGLLLGVTAALALQLALDRMIYGNWGASFVRYVIDNGMSRMTHWFWSLHERTSGAISERARDIALWFYEGQNSYLGYELDASHLEKRMLRPQNWYVVNIFKMLVFPVLVTTLLGVLRAVLKPKWSTSLLVLVAVLFAYVTSTKGFKSFRLWLPILPFLALLSAMGAQQIKDWLGGRASRRTQIAMTAWCLLAVPLCVMGHREANPRNNSSYWQAMEWLNGVGEKALAGGREEPLRVGVGFRWAVFLRNQKSIEIVREPHPWDHWHDEDESASADSTALSSERGEAPADLNSPPAQDQLSHSALVRRQTTTYLESLDWMMVHLAMLHREAGFFEVVNQTFDVRAVFYDQRWNAELGPLFVLQRSDASHHSEAHKFFDLRTGAEAAEARTRFGGSEGFLFTRGPDGDLESDPDRDWEELTFLGFDQKPLEGSPDCYWLTYHWYTETGFQRDYTIVDRVTTPNARYTFQNNHEPVYGTMPTSEWEPGTLLSESYLFLPQADPFGHLQGEQPHYIGGAFRRGELLPMSLWVGVIEEGSDGEALDELVCRGRSDLLLKSFARQMTALTKAGKDFNAAWQLAGERAGLSAEEQAQVLAPETANSSLWHKAGTQFSKDGLAEMGRFMVSVPEASGLADDGRRLPDE